MTIDKATIKLVLDAVLDEADKMFGGNPLWHGILTSVKNLVDTPGLLDAVAKTLGAKP